MFNATYWALINNNHFGMFLVSFLGKDERGEIVKGIEVMADSSEDAMNLIKEISISRDIYSAIDV